MSGVLGALAALGQLDRAASLAFALTLLFVGPHYAATYRRAFASREILRAHPIVTLVLPLLLALVACAAIIWPRTVGVVFFATYVIWSGYHYSGQSLGLAMLYPLRQGARLAPDRKKAGGLPAVRLLVGVAAGPVSPGGGVAQSRLPADPRGDVPGAPAGVGLLAVALVVLSLSSLVVLARRRRRRGTPLPRAVWSVVLAQVAWFCIGMWNPFFNIVLVPIFHGAQYLAITSWHQTRGRSVVVFAVYAATVVALGLVVNPGLMMLGRTSWAVRGRWSRRRCCRS